MKARFSLSIVALCIAGALAGCASVSKGTAFQPPSGWTGTPAMFGRFQLWMKSGGQKDAMQMVMLIKGNGSNAQIHDFNDVPPQYAKDIHVTKRDKITLCGDQPAEESIGEGTDKNGRRSVIQVISTKIGTDAYAAMYVRPQSSSADSQAEAALHSLCPAKSA